MNIKWQLKVWGGSLALGAFSGMMGFMAVDMGIVGAKRNISVMQEIPYSQVVSPFPDWLPFAVTVIMFAFGFILLQVIFRRLRVLEMKERYNGSG